MYLYIFRDGTFRLFIGSKKDVYNVYCFWTFKSTLLNALFFLEKTVLDNLLCLTAKYVYWS
jgi:hypothetical protein